MIYSPFVESNWGLLEAEMCKMLKVTPRGLGKLREEDPWGVEFLERHIINTWKKEKEYYDKLQRERKVGRGVRRHPKIH